MSHTATSLTKSEEAVARSGIYQLLARLWLHEVDRELLQKLSALPLSYAFIEAGGVLPSSDEQMIERLDIDYCQLFLGPNGHLPPYQSVWQTGQFQGTTITSMKNFIDVTGLGTSVIPKVVMLDHLGVQLAVMGHILFQSSTWQSPAAENLKSVCQLACTFFDSHLLWTTDLLEAAEQRANTDFYRSSICITRDFLKSEARSISWNE